MNQEFTQDKKARRRLRALRRARRYIRAEEGALARLLNTYTKVAELDPTRKFWVET